LHTHIYTHTHTHTQSGSQPARQERANPNYTFIWPQDGGTPSLLPSSVPTAGVGFSPSLSLTRSLHLSPFSHSFSIHLLPIYLYLSPSPSFSLLLSLS